MWRLKLLALEASALMPFRVLRVVVVRAISVVLRQSIAALGVRVNVTQLLSVVSMRRKAKETALSMFAAGKLLIVGILQSLANTVFSKWGYCGTTADFCGDGCQKNTKGSGCGNPP